MSDDARVDALARKLAGEMWDEPHTQDWWRRRVRALLPDTRAYWTDEARGDAHLVPPDEYEVAVVAQKQWREEALEARAERDHHDKRACELALQLTEARAERDALRKKVDALTAEVDRLHREEADRG